MKYEKKTLKWIHFISINERNESFAPCLSLPPFILLYNLSVTYRNLNYQLKISCLDRRPSLVDECVFDDVMNIKVNEIYEIYLWNKIELEIPSTNLH